MKFGKMVVMVLSVALVTLLCAVSCDGLGESNGDVVSQSDSSGTVSQSDSSIYGVDDGTTFPRGVWAVDDGERRLGYYIFTSGNSGSYIDTEYGTGVAFEVDIDGKKANFHMGGADFNSYAEVFVSDINKREIMWKEDNRTESLTLINCQDPKTFEFYCASDLLNSAYAYYESVNGSHPELFGTMVGVDGVVDIQLYNQVNGHNSTAAFYQVDSITGKGKDVNSGEAVDFSK